MAKNDRIECTLTHEAAEEQLLEWVEIQRVARSIAPIDGGASFFIPTRLEAQVRDLARREATCCSFLDIAVEVLDSSTFQLTMTSKSPEASPVIEALAGLSTG